MDVPKDITQAYRVYSCPGAEAVRSGSSSEDEISAAAELIANAKKPYIYAGGGVIGSRFSRAFSSSLKDIAAFA